MFIGTMGLLSENSIHSFYKFIEFAIMGKEPYLSVSVLVGGGCPEIMSLPDLNEFIIW